MNLTRAALNRPVTTLMIFVCFVVVGFISSRLLPLEFFPALDAPFIFIDIPYPGSTPEEIERQITRPAEEVIATISGIKEMTSNSYENGAWIQLDFDWGVDANLKALEAKEKLEGIRHLFPADLERFFVRKFSTTDMQMLVIRISSNRNLSNAYDMLNRNVKRRVERIAGVSKVDLYGVEPREIRIQLHADRVVEHRVDLGRLVQTLRRANFMVTAGKITDTNRRYVVRPMGEFQSVEEIGDVVVADNLYLRDIATITYDHPKLEYGRHLNQTYAIGLDIYKESGANLVEVTERIIEEINSIKQLPEMEGINIYYMDNQANGVTSSLNEIFKSGLIGGSLAVLVLFFFMRRVTTTLMVALAVPLSLLVTLTFMFFMGVSLNILSMMGLMLAVGMLVDNAVVATESIHRHQLMNVDTKTAVKRGVSEISLAITAGTLTTAIVFLPNIINPKDQVSLWLKFVAITICIALGVSLILALTIVPLIASRLKPPKPHEKETVIDKLVRRYTATLSWSMRHRRASVAITLGVLISIAVPIKLVKTDMFDEPEDRRLRLRYHINGNFTVEKVEEAVNTFEEYLFANEDKFEIESIYSYYQGNYAMSTILLEKGKKAKKPQEEIQKEILEGLPKLAIANPSFDWEHQSGGGETIRITLFGKSSEQLVELSRDIAWTLEQLEGFESVRSSAEAGDEEVHVVVDRDRARQYGFSTAEVANIVSAAMRGIRLRHFRDEEGEVEMRLEFQDEDRQTLEHLQNVPLMSPTGETVKLATLADFAVRRGPRSIWRENRTTAMSLTANLSGIEPDKARKKINQVLDHYSFPAGYSWSYGRRHDHEQEAMNTMLLNLGLALCLIYFVMASLFESLLFPAAIWTQILFAIVGVYWFFLVTGTTMSIMGMIGILILIGVVVNNGIVLVDHINQLRERGIGRTEAIIQAGRDRMRPILMTAGTTVLSLVPLCIVKTQIAGDGPPYYPMARAIVGGLTFSTIITLLVLPTIYVLLDDLRNWSRRVVRAAK